MKLKIFFVALIILSFISLVSADWYFYGNVSDVDGTPLDNATINITFWTMSGGPPTFVGYNSSNSSATGEFNFTVYENSTYFYKPVVTHFNSTTNAIDYIGQSLPHFPYMEFNGTTDINFYLKKAGTINITVVNATGSTKEFQYQVKDTKLGYPIAEGFGSYVTQATVYVPRDRNYTIQIYPNQSMPVSYHWNNFSANSSYNISTPSNDINLSNYNATTHTLHKQFNTSENLVWVSGYAFNFTGSVPGYDEFTVVPFILEAGSMVYLGENAAMPYNMSAWRRNGAGVQLWTDNYSLSTGFYNITLVGAAENVDYILFATARNGTDYYGGYRNISLNYSSINQQLNFTMYKLMGTNWNTSTSNITMKDATTWQNINISSAKQQFNLVNSTNATLGNMSAHIEVKVDYSDYNCTEFTFMTDISSGDASFYLPLLNATIKEMNIYSNNYAPKRVGTRTELQILANNNITMAVFNPGSIEEGAINEADIFIKLYVSNSTCNLPVPDESCSIGAFGPGEDQVRANFNPLSAIMGGGKLNFRMGYSGIEVVYINVDMIASGPPDVSFDDSEYAGTTTGSFETAFRFGSSGPTIYDYVLISMPYIEGSTTQTGLNEEADVNMSIPLFYDENWNVIWNSTKNSTNGTLLAGNHSHYLTYFSEWEILMGQNNCTRNQSELNATNPCYINTENNRIWIRLPHFSGTQPSVTGYVLTATPASDPEGSPSGGSSSTTSEWAKQRVHSWAKMTPGVVSIMKDFDNEIGIKQIQIEVKNEAQNVKITVRKYDSKPAEVSVEKSGKVYRYIQIETENLADKLEKATLRIQVNKSWVSDSNLDKEDIALFKFDGSANKWNELITDYIETDENYYYYNIELANFSYFAISEKTVEEQVSEEGTIEPTSSEGEIIKEKANLTWLWIIIATIVILVLSAIGYRKLKK